MHETKAERRIRQAHTLTDKERAHLSQALRFTEREESRIGRAVREDTSFYPSESHPLYLRLPPGSARDRARVAWQEGQMAATKACLSRALRKMFDGEGAVR